jgi:hypothetical protein
MELAVAISEMQRVLERHGCVFSGQERLDRHEVDPTKPCYCGRPNRATMSEPKCKTEEEKP